VRGGAARRGRGTAPPAGGARARRARGGGAAVDVLALGAARARGGPRRARGVAAAAARARGGGRSGRGRVRVGARVPVDRPDGALDGGRPPLPARDRAPEPDGLE